MGWFGRMRQCLIWLDTVSVFNRKRHLFTGGVFVFSSIENGLAVGAGEFEFCGLIVGYAGDGFDEDCFGGDIAVHALG